LKYAVNSHKLVVAFGEKIDAFPPSTASNWRTGGKHTWKVELFAGSAHCNLVGVRGTVFGASGWNCPFGYSNIVVGAAVPTTPTVAGPISSYVIAPASQNGLCP
jgi:hypothetical protein